MYSPPRVASPSQEHCWPFRLARLLSSVVPRGKGAIPRIVGRMARPWISHAFVTRHGARIPLLPEALDAFVAMSLQGNSYDYWVFRAANAMLETGSVFYDIGANVGYMSIEVAHLRASDGVQVYAFEPHPSLAKNIAQAVKINRFDNLIHAEAAVGDSSGYLGFSQDPNSFIGSVTQAGAKASYQVTAVTVDELVNDKGYQPPDVIKIDVEGYEHAVLSGARQVLAERLPVVVFEISPGTSRYGRTPEMIVDLLREAGDYSFYTIKCDPLSRREIAEKAGTQADILAIPPRRQARFDWFEREFRAGRIDSCWDV